MSKPQKAKMRGTIREVPAKWDYNEGEELKVADVRVLYYSPTIAQLKADRLRDEERREADPTATTWLSDVLSEALYSIRDLPLDPHLVTNPTVEWLDEQDLPNLRRVQQAIEADLSAGK